MTEISVLAWDDPRGYAPLEDAARQFMEAHPGTRVRIDCRPLSAFEDQDIVEATAGHDLICIDHPFLGEAVEAGAILNIDELAVRHGIAVPRGSVGPTDASYVWQGSQWILAADAACQVAAWLPNVLGTDFEPPRTLEAALHLAEAQPGLVGQSLNPIHCSCTFISLCAGSGESRSDAGGMDVPEPVAREAILFLRAIAKSADPRCANISPIEVMDLMCRGDSPLGYAPFIFGYSNYGREGYRAHRARFGDVPSNSGTPEGAILGGVGLAVTARTALPAQALSFGATVCRDSFQAGPYFAAGGQPAARAAWDDPALDTATNSFFSQTRASMETAHVRPRFRGFHTRQRMIAHTIHNAVWNDGDLTRAAANATAALRA